MYYPRCTVVDGNTGVPRVIQVFFITPKKSQALAKFYEVDIKQLFSCNFRKYNISMLSRSSDFVHYFSECGLIFAVCKRN